MPTVESILGRKGTDVATIDHNATVLEAARQMNARRIGALVVIKEATAVGIFTERDVLNRVVAAEKPADRTRVGEVMTAPMACCRRDTKLAECRAVMTARRIRHLPVVEGGKLYGIISIGDLMASEVADQQQTIEYLHQYIHGRS